MALIKIEKHHSSTTPVLVYETQTDQLRIREICCFPIYVHMHIHTKTNKDLKKTQTTNNNNKNATKQSQNQNINSKKIQTTTKQQIQIWKNTA